MAHLGSNWSWQIDYLMRDPYVLNATDEKLREQYVESGKHLSLEVCKISFAWGQIPAPLHSLHKVGLTCAIAVSPTLFRQTLSVSSLSQRAPLSLGPQAILSHNSLVKTVEVPRPPLFGEKKKLYLMHTGTSGLTSGGGLQAWNGAVVKRSQRYLKSYFFCSESALFVYRVCLCSQHRIFFF